MGFRALKLSYSESFRALKLSKRTTDPTSIHVLNQDSENCYFGIRCKNKLCQFKHIEKKKNEHENNLEVDLEDEFNNSHDDIANLNVGFDELSEKEKHEAKKVFWISYTFPEPLLFRLLQKVAVFPNFGSLSP